MPQKILAGRADDPMLGADLVTAKVDQVILSKEPARALELAIRAGLKKTSIEVAVAYDTHCVTNSNSDLASEQQAAATALQHGVLVCRAGIGFPAGVHLERFAAPARLAVTDEPRLASVGGGGMLTLVLGPAQLAEALVKGTVVTRPPRSVQVLLSGKVRPFVCIRDVALELLRRGLGEVVARIDQQFNAPVVLEFAGPSARLLSVPERALLCSLAPDLGAAGAVFVSDEKTEVYLRDQRRSKAHRALTPDAGAPCDEVVTIDLSTVDPLIMDEEGVVRPVRELEGKPVVQAVLGGDSGTSLRDMLAAAALLKSKRVPSSLDFLVAPASRQMLEVLAQTGALVDMIATGARLLEPDHRVLTGELYPPPDNGVALRTFTPAPGPAAARRYLVASAETLAYAVATGKIGDPRSFKRPVRVTVPRTLPTDDVLLVRKKLKVSAAQSKKASTAEPPPAPASWKADTELSVSTNLKAPVGPTLYVLETLEQVQWLASRATEFAPNLRAVVSVFLPSAYVPLFSSLGILALTGVPATLKAIAKATTLRVSGSSAWTDDVTVAVASESYSLQWRAVGTQRDWIEAP